MNFNFLYCKPSSIQSQVVAYTPSLTSNHEKVNPQYIHNYSKDAKYNHDSSIPLVILSQMNKLVLCEQAVNILRDNLEQDVAMVAVLHVGAKPQTDEKKDEKHEKHEIQCIKMQKYAKQSKNGHRVFILSAFIQLDEEQNSKKMEIIIAFLMFLGSGLILEVQNCKKLLLLVQILNTIYKKMAQFLPDELIILTQQPQISKIQLLVHHITKIVLQKQRKSNLQQLLQIWIAKSKVKKYKKVKITGNMLYSLLLNYCFLQIKDAEQMNLNLLFEPIIKELHHNNYLYHKKLYDTKIKVHLVQEQPFTLEQLLRIYQQTKEQIIEHYPLGIDQQLDNKYLQDFEDYVDQKQRLIIEINKKKCHYYMKTTLQQKLQSLPKRNMVQVYQQNLRAISKDCIPFDHGTIGMMTGYLTKIFQSVHRNQKKSEKHFIKSQRQRQLQLQRQIENIKKESVLEKEKKQSQKMRLIEEYKQSQKLTEIEASLNQKIVQLRKETKENRQDKRDLLQQKLQFQEKMQVLLDQIRDMEEIERENNTYLQHLRNGMDFDPNIDRMQRKLSQIQRKCNILQKKYSKLSISSSDPKPKEQNEVNITFFNNKKQK